MENVTSEASLVDHMISGGAKHFGFVGDIEHCNSFYERWIGFCEALNAAGLPLNRDVCILAEDGDLYGDVYHYSGLVFRAAGSTGTRL